MTVNNAAEMIVGAAHYPSYLVNTRVIASNGVTTDASYATDEFEIDEMTLRNKTDPAVQNVALKCGISAVP